MTIALARADVAALGIGPETAMTLHVRQGHRSARPDAQWVARESTHDGATFVPAHGADSSALCSVLFAPS
jgi:hypothetical protein